MFLIIPLVYLELGRPKDLIKAFLNLLIGLILIIKNSISEKFSAVNVVLFTSLVILYVLEIFSSRWGQLTEKEKNKIKAFTEFRKNISKIKEAFTLGFNNLKNSVTFLKVNEKNENINQKKWVRKDKNDSINF